MLMISKEEIKEFVATEKELANIVEEQYVKLLEKLSEKLKTVVSISSANLGYTAAYARDDFIEQFERSGSKILKFKDANNTYLMFLEKTDDGLMLLPISTVVSMIKRHGYGLLLQEIIDAYGAWVR